MLRDWCYDDSSGWVRWKLITGDTGRGKTRLVMRLLEVLKDEGGRPWNVGFLDLSKLRFNPETLLYFDVLPGDFVFVVDYAERFEPEVRAVMKASLALGDGNPERRVRVVFISRRRSDLWDRIAESDMDIGGFMSQGLSEFEPSPLGQDQATREAAFDDAYAAFAEHFREERDLKQRPDLNQQGFDEAILIHLAALSVYLGEVSARDVSEDALLEWILVREKRHWDELVESRTGMKVLKQAPIQQAAAYLTLVSLGEGIRSRDKAVESLKRCPLLDGVDPATLAVISGIFHDLYPGPGWVNGVTPDLVGAYFLSIIDDDFIEHLYERLEPS